ncbi:MAG: hypothetical protein ACT4OG_04770 [Alphaproteobacteria bacterium]
MRHWAALAMCLLLADPARAGPWLPERGGGEFLTATVATYSDDAFESVPNPLGLPRFTLGTHLEYGLADRVTLLADAAMHRFAPGDLNFGTSGYRLDKAMLGLRMRLAQGRRAIISIEGLFGTDAVYDNTPREIFASTRGAAELRLMLGDNFKVFGLDSFAAWEAGGRWRAGPPANEVLFDATFGIAPGKRSLLLLQSFFTVSVGEAQLPYRSYVLSKVQASAAYRVYEGAWLQFGGFASLVHEDTGAERGALVSVWWRF